MKLFFAFLYLVALVSGKCGDKPKKPPLWSPVYSVRGTISVPYAEIEEPFEAWYDTQLDKSRIDYYEGIVKTYQLSSEPEYGSSIKLIPETTEKKQNVESCLQINGTEDTSITLQSVLPDLDGYHCVGEETIHEVETEVWEHRILMNKKMVSYTMYLYYKKDPNNKQKIAVPVRYEMKGFNSLFEGTLDHTYLDYDNFSIAPIPDDIFQIDPNLQCNEMGDAGSHVYTFNPMAEFIYPERTEHVDSEFDRFTRKHKKQYKNESEVEMRLDIFRKNLRFINSMNRKNLGFSLAVNHLADRTPDELKAMRGRLHHDGYNGGEPFPYKNIPVDDIPDEWDWTLYGAVTPVKDQSICGSCWTFGSTGAIEGAWFLKTGFLISMSQQALIDCSWGFENFGCDGGEDFRAYQWVMTHDGIPTDESYGPYLSQDGVCHADDEDVIKIAKIKGYVNVTVNDEEALKLAIFKHGPVSVAMDASPNTLMYYANGVYYDPKCGNGTLDLNHAVLAVGYGSMKGKNYWLIKNSWSNYWGNDGYVLISTENNNCGIMTVPTYVYF